MLIETFEPGDATRYVVGAECLNGGDGAAACGFGRFENVMLYLFGTSGSRPWRCAAFRCGEHPYDYEREMTDRYHDNENLWTVAAGYIVLCHLLEQEPTESDSVNGVLHKWHHDWRLQLASLTDYLEEPKPKETE